MRAKLIGTLATIVVAAALGPALANAQEREYELVSPPDTGGVDIYAGGSSTGITGLSPASPDGDTVIFDSNSSPFPGFDGVGNLDAYRARRAADGWMLDYVGVPGNAELITTGTHGWSLDHSTVAYVVQGGNPYAEEPDPQDGVTSLYARDGSGAIDWVSQGSLPVSDLSPFGPQVVAISADGSRIVFASGDRLEPEAPPPPDWGLYARSRGVTEFVSLAPDESTPLLAGYALQTRLSDDGTRLAFEGLDPDDPDRIRHVYLREGGATTEISASEKPEPDAPQSARLESLSADGSTTFLSTAEQLLPGDTDTSRDLYAYDAENDALTLLSTGTEGGNSDSCSSTYGAAKCNVDFVSASRDGSTMVFISPEILESGAVAGAANVYVSRAGTTRFVATLTESADLSGVNQVGLLAPNGPKRPIRITPDGHFVVFEAETPLSGTATGGFAQVWLLDVEAGALSCASCPPAGGVPSSDARLRHRSALSSFVGPYNLNHGRNITDDGGHIYFQTRQRLAGKDVNDRIDIYDYDVAGGEHRLISAGTGPRDSYYYDSSADGRDVFFMTTDTLVPQDRNGGTLKLYDARRGGGFPAPPAPPAPCAGSDCQGPSAPQPPAEDPGSGVYEGDGNPVDCTAPRHRAKEAKQQLRQRERRAQRRQDRARDLRRAARRADGKRARRLGRRAGQAQRRAKRAQRRVEAAQRAQRRAKLTLRSCRPGGTQ